jgi:hypothetical protein
MVIVRLLGGLGNQMFQYAAGRQLAAFHQTELKLDVSFYRYRGQDHTYRNYGLRHLSVHPMFAQREEIVAIQGTPTAIVLRIASALNRRLNPFFREPFFSETQVGPFKPEIWSTPRDVYLDGYWQSEKYFSDISGTVRREFAVRHELDVQNGEMAARIRDTQSVSVHVRRGDYVSDPTISLIHGTCGLDYYLRSIHVIADQVVHPHFFVFSDDLVWAKENLRLDYPTTFVDHNNSDTCYEDLRLMSLCRHNITANSSFSWWGAWLNANPTKVVVAPKRWFRDASRDTRDLFPDGWITM